ncbi:Polyamine transporter 4 [Nakaseomyces bracarensis]|uniref:Polyamine transporter 4 n=1 Tax=Nakaseomyces bracarensis TaxID=273131 RepID=A0ABR4NXC1_9SACH
MVQDQTSDSHSSTLEVQNNDMVDKSSDTDLHSKSDSPESDQECIDPKTLDWDGPGDMDNPHNWPGWKKWYATMVCALLCLAVTMNSSLYVSGVTELVMKYHVNQTLALAGLTFYLLGLANVIGAPLSEVFGRKPIYLGSLPLSMLFTMGVGLSGGHMRVILPLRFFAGFFASPCLSVGSGTILDVFDVDEVSVAMTFFSLAPFLGPVISPIIAGFAVEERSWRYTQWIQLWASGLILPFIAIMPETHKGMILRRRAKKRGLKLKAFSRAEQKAFLKLTFTITIMRPLKMLVVEPIVLVFSIYVAFIFAVLFAFFEAYPVIYRGVYHMDLGVSGLPFIGIGVGLWLGAMLYMYIDRKYLFPKAPKGTPPIENPTSLRTEPYRGLRNPETGELLPIHPERFLLACKIGSVALPVALFWQAWTSRPDVQWMAPIAAGVPFGFGLILIFFSVLMYFSTCYPPMVVASTLAANNMLRYITSSVFPLFTIQMYTNMKIKWASTLFALICVVMIPIPWIFERWGPKLRVMSQFGYTAMAKQAQMQKDQTTGESNDQEIAEDLDLTRITTLRTMETEYSHDAVLHTNETDVNMTHVESASGLQANVTKTTSHQKPTDDMYSAASGNSNMDISSDNSSRMV